MRRSAPRYDPRILDALRRLDDRMVSIAEVCRRVGTFADEIGVERPSYVNLRRYIVYMREEDDAAALRREEIRGIAAETALKLALGVTVNPDDVAKRVAEAGRDRS